MFKHFSHSGKLSIGLGLAALVLLCILFFASRSHGGVHPSTDLTPNPSLTDIEFIPESERPLDVCVVGIDPAQASYLYLPTLKSGRADRSFPGRKLQEQVYWLDLELSHGRIFQSLPSTTQLYVALPDPRKVSTATGKESELFRGYLMEHCHWDRARIQQKVHFFNAPGTMIWAQDIGKILGKDREGRWVLFRSRTDLKAYYEGVGVLCQAFPDRFACRDLPDGISAEGGDEDLVRDHGGQLILMIGRHRAVRYLQWKNGFTLESVGASPAFGQELEPAQVDGALEAYRAAFSPLAVAMMPEKILRDPEQGNEELFHLDMGVGVVGLAGQEQAFVPTYLSDPVNRQDGQPLDPAFVKGLQTELDAIASEMKSMDFPVIRVPITDHPVRSPANFVRFLDTEKGKCEVLISKYPRINEGPFENSSQGLLLQRLSQLRFMVEAWEKAPTKAHLQAALDATAQVWAQMDAIAHEPNPLFEEQKANFEKKGIEVVAIPDFPWGAGGLHCETLH